MCMSTVCNLHNKAKKEAGSFPMNGVWTGSPSSASVAAEKTRRINQVEFESPPKTLLHFAVVESRDALRDLQECSL